MNRRKFTQLSVLSAVAASLPITSFASSQTITTLELLGQGNPSLITGPDYKLRPQASQAFLQMQTAAKEDGITLKVVSSYRNYAHQNRIWERKFKRFRESGLSPTPSILKIIEYSTIPGTSRHHWGTDIDIIDGNPDVSGDVLVPSKFHGTGPFCAMKEWMDANANKYDFKLVYTDAPDRKGFKYEPWHYSYAPLSIPYLKAYRQLDIKAILQEEKLIGSDSFNQEFMDQYINDNILDINPALFG